MPKVQRYMMINFNGETEKYWGSLAAEWPESAGGWMSGSSILESAEIAGSSIAQTRMRLGSACADAGWVILQGIAGKDAVSI